MASFSGIAMDDFRQLDRKKCVLFGHRVNYCIMILIFGLPSHTYIYIYICRHKHMCGLWFYCTTLPNMYLYCIQTMHQHLYIYIYIYIYLFVPSLCYMLASLDIFGTVLLLGHHGWHPMLQLIATSLLLLTCSGFKTSVAIWYVFFS